MREVTASGATAQRELKGREWLAWTDACEPSVSNTPCPFLSPSWVWPRREGLSLTLLLFPQRTFMLSLPSEKSM